MARQFGRSKLDKFSKTSYYPKPELVIIKDRLAYKIKIYASYPRSHRIYYIDATDRNLLDVEELIKHANSTGSGQTRYSGTQTIISDSFSGGYRLRETRNGTSIQTLNMNMGTSYASSVDFVDNDNNWTSTEYNNIAKDNSALDAHWGAEMVYDYFYNTFGRNSWNNSGGTLLNYVHANLVGMGYSSNDNAFWDGQRMTYGDGQYSFSPLTSLDVVAHEIGHGLMSSTANLSYNKESGALNEGFSDIWAACVEAYAAPSKKIWEIGEDISLYSSALRSMSNPKSHGQPNTYGGTYWINVSGCSPNASNDYCGVHTNSGVLNFWFYLLSVGGSGINDIDNTYSVNGIGITDAAKIAYRTITVTLTNPSATFNNARTASIQAAIDLFGDNSCQVKSVVDAWYAVGVGNSYTGTLGYSIAGQPYFCINTTYNIPNLPTGATVTWTATGSLSISGANNVNPVSVSKISDGTGTLTANINTSCGTISINKTGIIVGTPEADAPNGFSYAWADGESYGYNINDYPGAISYEWFVYGGGNYPPVVLQIGDTAVDVAFYSPGSYGIYVKITTDCGEVYTLEKGVYVEPVSSYNLAAKDFSVYPNPTTSIITISRKSDSSPFQVLLYNKKGEKVREQAGTQSSRNIIVDTEKLEKGMYFLHIVENNKVINRQTIIKE